MPDGNPIFLEAFYELAKQKNVPPKKISEILKEAITKMFLKEDPDAHVEVDIDLEKGFFEIHRLKKVIPDEQTEYDDFNEIPLSVACADGSKFVPGDFVREAISPEKFDWSMTTYVRQVFIQRLTELLNKAVAEEWISRVGEVIIAEVEKIDEKTKSVVVNVGKTNGYVSKKNQIPNESLIPGKKYKFVVEKVKEQSRDWPISLSRTSPKLVQYELEMEIPEIAEKQIKIEKIVRIPGFKTKLAISCNFPGIDPVGSCLGVQGSRVKHVSAQLNGEKIDVILWSDDPKKMVMNAVWPVRLIGIEIVSEQPKKTMTIVVKDEKDLSTVIGKAGKNIKLLTQLIDWGIDVVTKEQADAQNIFYTDCTAFYEQFRMDHSQRPLNKSAGFSLETRSNDFPDRLHTYTTVVKNDDAIEVDIAAETKKPATEAITPGPSDINPPSDDVLPLDSGTNQKQLVPAIPPIENLLDKKNVSLTPTTPVIPIVTNKENKKVKKRATSHKKINLSELTFEIVQSDKEHHS